MEQALWRRAEHLFHAALDQPPEARRAFLDEACGDDAELRRQVEMLLSKDEQVGRFLESPVLGEFTRTIGARASLVGRQFGSYRILSLLGAGGMSEVYRAHDSRLGRDVAIKTLPPEFARDPVRLARFRREARTLAALSHPNIAAIYGLEESAEVDYLVLELVEGNTLHGPLPLATALECASQVVDALQAAHEHGIIHRDLKPSNVKITPQNRVKVLDFGLAKPIWEMEEPHPAQPGTLSGAGTTTGQIVGTPGYMSPEQARGEEVDQRADIWAFGCLLYELLAGQRAFRSDTASGATAAAVEGEPDWQALPAGTPGKVRDLLRQCLQKEVNCRLSNIADARATLLEALRLQRRRAPQHAAATPARARHPAAERIHVLAVLPLVNLSGDPEQDYFADGMTDALTTELAQIHALRVISRTSAMHYKGSTKTVPEIARELGVDGVVEGSVMRIGGRVRITAELIHAATDRHLWARSYGRDLRDVLRLQSEVAQAIADEIQVTLTPQERARLSRARPVNVEAHEAYIRGHYHWGHGHPDRSIEHFQRAIAIDPDNAQAYAGMADAQCMLFGAAIQVAPTVRLAPLARTAAIKALELDESLAEPHVTLARVLLWHDRDAVGAERELRRATQLNPNCAMAHFHCGLLFADLKRSDEAIAAFQRALQLDPVSPWNGAIAGWAMYELGHEQIGMQQLEKAIELDANFFFAWSLVSILHIYEGKCPEAVAEAQEAVRLSAGLPTTHGWLAYVLGMAGRRAEALAILEQLEELSQHRYVPASARCWAFVGLDEYDRVIEWMEKGYLLRDSGLPHFALTRAFNPLRSDPRFHDLLRRLGLVQ